MTPAEARQIDKQEFEAECRAARQRAHQHVEQCRQEQKAVIDRCIGRRERKPKVRLDRAISKTKLYTANGETKTATEWAQIVGISYSTFMSRLRIGMSIERAVSMPPRGRALTVHADATGDDRPGVSCDFAPSEGTGAGTTAQEIPNITFTTKAANE